MCLNVSKTLHCVIIACFLILYSGFAQAQSASAPPSLTTLQEKEPDTIFEDFSEDDDEDESEKNEFNLRAQAQREAALSFGARGGLAARTYEIRQHLAKQEVLLDRSFDFRRLLMRAPSGLLMEPPIIGQANDALILESNGQEAAVADQIFNINQPAKIVTTPRNWRTYLEREWGEVAPPPDLLLPQNSRERAMWRQLVAQGFEQGYAQADAIFQTDLDHLVADLSGMVRYRILLAQGMVSAPFALEEDRGITGDGTEMRIGDRAVKITGPSQLKTGADQWQPVSR